MYVNKIVVVFISWSGGGSTKRPSAAPGTPPPAMTSGNESEAPTVTGSTPQNGENKPPQAIVKPQVLTHVIEGFVIQEGAEPFPVCVSVLISTLLAARHYKQATTLSSVRACRELSASKHKASVSSCSDSSQLLFDSVINYGERIQMDEGVCV